MGKILRRTISFTMILSAIFFIYQFAVNYLKSGHFISYTIETSSIFSIDEKYTKNKNDDYYLINVNVDDKSFIFDIDNYFNKQRKIVKDVKVYNNDNLYCLSLIFIDKYSSEPICYKDDKLLSYYYSKNNYDLNEYVSSIPSFELNKYDKDSEKKKVDNIIVYSDNLFEDEILSLYEHKKVHFMKKYYNRSFIFSNRDNYKNTLGTIVDDYYVIPRYTGEPTIKSFVKYEIIGGIKREFKANYEISKQSYVNGVYDGKLYIFDKSNMKQYQIDPKNETVTITGDEEHEAFAFINGEEKRVSVYDLNSNEVKFSKKYDEYKDIDYDDIFINNYYAIYRKGDNFYKVYLDYIDKPILLFNESGAKEVKLVEDSLYYIKGDKIFRYSKYGIQTLIVCDELKYNYENVFDIFISEEEY